MSLLPDAATFEELVQDCFLTLRGSGLMLSPLDVEVLDEWRAAEVPFEVVARGIRRAAEAALFDVRPGGQALRSLRACRRQVAAEITKYRGRAAGQATPAKQKSALEPAHLVRHKKLLSALRKLIRDDPKLFRLARWVDQAAAHPPATLAESERMESVADAALIRALPYPDRMNLLREARALDLGTTAVSARARRISRRFHRGAVLRRKLELPAFW